jgi:hypothetical protein
MGFVYLNMSSFIRAMLIVLCALWILPELAHAKHVRTRHYKFNVCVLHFIIMIFFVTNICIHLSIGRY